MNKNHFNGRTMHIDISRRFYQIGNTGVAFKIIPSNKHKGLALSNKLKRELKRDFNIQEDYARLSAICIFYLIKDSLNLFDNLVICNDEHYLYVKEYLDLFFEGSDEYFSKNITSISKLREITGDKKIRSYADNIANIYRRKALKPLRRRQKGIRLDVVDINYLLIKDKLKELNEKVSG